MQKKCLKSLGSFGITDRYGESLKLMRHALQLEQPLHAKTQNQAPNKPQRSKLGAGVKEEIEARTRYDRQLYELALTLFNARLQEIG